MRVSVLICTRERLHDLERCCASLSKLRFRAHEAPQIDIVVVDNTPGGTPGLDASQLEDRAGHRLSVVTEPRLGIAFARNTALAHRHPSADYVAFVDDDETVAPSWLDHLLTVAEDHDAELVAGPALPRLPPNAIDAARAYYLGGAASLRRPTGTELSWAATGNLLVRATWLDRHPDLRFDERIGLAGGEDIDWTTRANARGAQLVWADRAVVWHWISEERATVHWIVRRSYTSGQSMGRYERSQLSLAQLARRAATIVRHLGRSSTRYARCRARGENDEAAVWMHAMSQGRGWCAGVLHLRVPELYRVVT